MSAVADKRYALVLSGGGVRATAFHLGVILRLAVDGQLERVGVLSTVSGGSLAAGLVFSRAGLAWPSSGQFVEAILPEARSALAEHSLQGGAFVRLLRRPWKLFASRGDIFAEALEKVWGIRGTLKEIAEEPRWLINATCYETGRNWRFSQKHIGDWKFGHNFTQSVPISLAIAASAAIPYMAGLVQLSINPDGWFSVNPATDEPVEIIRPVRDAVRLWDGGVYENLGMEAVYKPQCGFVDKDIGLMIISDASAYLGDALGPATGVFTIRYPFLRPPRLFDIATEQTRSLRARILGLRYVVPCFADWQGNPIQPGNCDYDVVECGSQVMNGVADDQRDAGWKLCNADGLDPLLSGLKIILDDQSCEVRIKKGVVLVDKFVDVALGPLNF
jgi:NTE family protein